MEASNDTPLSEDAPYVEIPIETESTCAPNPTSREVSYSQKVTKESKVWEHYTKMTDVPNRVKCIYCPKDYAYNSEHGTTTLWKHLRTQCIKSPLFKKGFVSPGQQTTLAFKEVDSVKGGGKKRDLVTHKFDNERCKKSLIRMIVKDEYAFRMVEKEGFREFCAENLPLFTIPSRWTVARECLKLFNDERLRLKSIFQNEKARVCLTTDAWTSIQNMSYMSLTVHFIDHNWNYQKRLINFCLLADHKGDTIGKTIESCLLEWGIENVFTITLDNATANDVAINYIKKRLKNWKVEIAGGNWLHVRCAAHILNLVVSEGLKNLHRSILCIRNAIRYLRASPARMSKFKECAEREKLPTTALVCLDVSTRWNSTYRMLESACKLQKAFERMEEDDGHYKIYFIENEKDGPPSHADWENAKVFVDVLSTFYDVTLRFSGSLHVTSCGFFQNIGIVNDCIQNLCLCDDSFLRDMGFMMKTKFEKYWGDPTKINHFLFVSVVLDPRMKLVFLSWAFGELYGTSIANEMTVRVKSFLESLYDEYRTMEGDNQESVNVTHPSSVGSSTSSAIENPRNHFLKKFQMIRTSQSKEGTKSEVERYLSDDTISDVSDSFDVLAWWRVNSVRFKILSRIAKDVLAIPVSTVASESAFSTGGRVLDQFRSSLNPNTAEALLCAQDWLRSTNPHLELEIEELVKEGAQWFETELGQCSFDNPSSAPNPQSSML